ncbi:MAG: AMP-binding protein [Candidatus Eremiobacteraeota bacterium]|nr:AMP-binding protein [Candidatus Eremiobacteraeota bacterium]
MLSYAHGASSAPLIGETIGAHFDRIAAACGNRDAVVSLPQRVRLTYAELKEATDLFARGLLALGVEHGDRVGIWSTNNVEWVVTQFATAKIGAILVNVNPAYRTAELGYALEQSGVSVLVSEIRYKSSEYVEMLREVRPSLPQLRDVVLIGEEELVAPLEGALRWRDTLELAAPSVHPGRLAGRLAQTQFDEPINIQYTSGTTGFPKGATLSHHNILNNGFYIGEACRYTKSDRVCIPVPFYHCFGMVLGNLACVTHGAAMVIPAATFDARATLAAVSSERCTSLYGVPTMFIAELALPEFSEFDLQTLRTGIMAGAPCPVEVMRRVQSEMHMPEVTICYGMTETSPVSTQTAVDDPVDKRTATVGRVHPHLEIKIVDAEGRIVPRGTSGELCTRGYSVMLGYWNADAATAQVIDAARFMHTGDSAAMDDDGYVAITGRIKDLVIRGGENISPREIEEFLYLHPAIRDIAVVGVPDEKYGEELCAWIVPKDATTVDAASVRAFCEGRIAHYKIPRYVIVVDAFPLTVTGKIQKYKMREESIVRLGLANAQRSTPA